MNTELEKRFRQRCAEAGITGEFQDALFVASQALLRIVGDVMVENAPVEFIKAIDRSQALVKVMNLVNESAKDVCDTTIEQQERIILELPITKTQLQRSRSLFYLWRYVANFGSSEIYVNRR